MTEKKPTQAAINAAILERLEQLNQRLEGNGASTPIPASSPSSITPVSEPMPVHVQEPTPAPVITVPILDASVVTQSSKSYSLFLWLDKNWKPVLVGLIIGLIIGFSVPRPSSISIPSITKSAIEKAAASEVADISFQERAAVATAMRFEADRIDGDPRDNTRLEARANVSNAIAQQQSKDRWKIAGDRIADAIHSTDPITYSKNLRLAADGISASRN